MSQNFSETSLQKNNMMIKGLNLDLNESYIDEQSWSYALNAVNATHQGDEGILGNEASNVIQASAPYTIIGLIDISMFEVLVFSTDDIDSEIGVFHKVKKTYIKKVNDRGLAFKRSHLVTGVVKSMDGVTKVVYFCDNLNPDRAMNLDKIPYKKTGVNLSGDGDCNVPEYSDELDTDAIRLTAFYNTPCIAVKRSKGSGQLPNGSYQAVIAYSEKGIRLTDYTIPGNPIAVWNHTGSGNSVEILLEGLDRNFDEYELIVISTVNQQTVAKKIGNYSTAQTRVTLDQIPASLQTLPLSVIPLRSPVYEKSRRMFKTGKYLLRTDLTAVKPFNYQLQANKIRTRWAAVEYPSDYYKSGENVSYLRDEVYAFFIRWVHASGYRFPSFTIPGRSASSTDMDVLASSPDKVSESEQYRWQIYDTSTRVAADEKLADGGRIIARGEMGYHQSSEKYPDTRPDIWGDLCGKPIRHHKMPSNETIHIHSQGGDKIVVLGVEFDHIEYPRDTDGNLIPDIVGYEILRGSREGNKSVVAKGLFNNMFEYQMQGTTSKKGLYQNYPYNDLNPDKFLVKNMNWLKKERLNTVKINAEPGLDTYRKDMFSFHSPDTTFNKPYISAPHVKIYTEQQCSITGGFELPYKHPGHKILTDATLGSAALIGISGTLLSVMGQMSGDTDVTAKVGFLGTGVEGRTGVGRVSGLGSVFGDIGANFANVSGLAGTITAGVMLATQSAILLYQHMDAFMDLAYKMTSFKKFELQYNSHGFYDKFAPVRNTAAGNKPAIRRAVPDGKAKYIGDGIQDFDTRYRINNLNRNPYVALQLGAEVDNPRSITERSRIALRDKPAGLNHENPFGTFTSQGVSYYGALKVDFENQYGQLESVVQLPISSCVFPVPYSGRGSTGVLFGGDTYINRYTEKNPYMFFNSWLVDAPDGTEIDYTNYVNGPIPRYWADFNQYGMDDFKMEINLFKGKKKKEMKRELEKLEGMTDDNKLFDITTPSDFHKFDRGSNTGLFALKNCWFYLFCNGTRDFFVESEINLAFRDYGESDHEKFFDPFGEVFTDLSLLYRSDKIKLPTQHRYDFSLSASKLYNNFASWGFILPNDYDESEGRFFPKRAIYSLPHQDGLKRDNWRNFLGANYKDFSDKITHIKSMNEAGALILFEASEPVEFVGQDTLQTESGAKFTVGDAGLFQQEFRSMVNADNVLDIGSCQSYYSTVNTPFGLFWMNMRSGNIFRYSGQAQDIGLKGVSKWLNKHLPSKLLQVYPEYPLFDNPVHGIGCVTNFDPDLNLVYFSKKDYIPLRSDLDLDENGQFFDGGTKVSLTDTRYFKPAGFTISFDPKEEKWLSLHSWIPDLPMSGFHHFHTVKDKGIWKHNDSFSSFGFFYGKEYPFKVEGIITTPGTVTTLRNVEYYLEVFSYQGNGDHKFHHLDENFDEAVIYNSEQISGTLKLIEKPKNNPIAILGYPKIKNGLVETLYSKEEHRIRFNQFWDAVKDRGELSSAQTPVIKIKDDGHDRIVNTAAIDLTKPVTQRKKFRHYLNRILLVKYKAGNKKLMLKLLNTKHLFSSR